MRNGMRNQAYGQTALAWAWTRDPNPGWLCGGGNYVQSPAWEQKPRFVFLRSPHLSAEVAEQKFAGEETRSRARGLRWSCEAPRTMTLTISGYARGCSSQAPDTPAEGWGSLEAVSPRVFASQSTRKITAKLLHITQTVSFSLTSRLRLLSSVTTEHNSVPSRRLTMTSVVSLPRAIWVTVA